MGSKTFYFLIQALFVAAVVGVLGAMVITARDNLTSQHIANGFGFLLAPTGWDVGSSLIAHSAAEPYWRTFLVGLLNTLMLSLICVVGATFLGTMLGALAVSQNPLLGGIALLYVNAFRNIPIIVQLFFWYDLTRQLPPVRQAIPLLGLGYLSNRGLYLPALAIDRGLPAVLAAIVLLGFSASAAWQWLRRVGGAPSRLTSSLVALSAATMLVAMALDPPRLRLIVPELKGFNFTGGILLGPEFVALITAIILYNIAFIAEIIRAGIIAVPKGQTEAARSLGLPAFRIFSTITLPQALRVMIPPLTSQYISIAKSTSLAVAIGYTDLFSVATVAINNTGQSLENIALVMIAYAGLSGALSALGAGLSRAFRWPGAR